MNEMVLGKAADGIAERLSWVWNDETKFLETDQEKLAQLKEQVSFMIGDAYFPPFPDNTFKAVFMLNNLFFAVRNESLPKKLVSSIMAHVGRVVEPNGYLLLSCYEEYLVYQKGEDGVLRLTNSHFNDPDPTKYDNRNLFATKYSTTIGTASLNHADIST